METIQNNKLIAEFMGYELEETLADNIFVYAIPTINNNLDFFEPNELLYHTDWNWLMKVIKEILTISLELDTMELYYDITDNIPNIEETYKSILEFINWFNKD